MYKKCEAVIRVFHTIFDKIWKAQTVSYPWGLAVVVRLSKYDILDKPEKFRPIAFGSCTAKLLCYGLANRVHVCFVCNDCIQCMIQHGFIQGVYGCIDHTFIL